MKVLKKLIYSRFFAWFLIVVGLILVAGSIYLYQKQPKPPALTKTNTISIAKAPSAVKLTPKAIATYTVPASYPKFLAIPSINIPNTPVVPLGLLASGAIATPDNIYETGWYTGSSKPGQSGAMFIYGHVSSWTADGIFYNLKKLVPGNFVSITRGDNKVFKYKVISTKIYPYNNVNMQQVLSPVDANTPGLNLMTCTGQVISGTSEFNERLVVFTSLVSSS